MLRTVQVAFNGSTFDGKGIVVGSESMECCMEKCRSSFNLCKHRTFNISFLFCLTHPVAPKSDTFVKIATICLLLSGKHRRKPHEME